MVLRLHYAAISDVGRVRKDNQDSGYAGPWLLAVCDGVGGAARGDVASSTAVQQLRTLDTEPDDELLSKVAWELHRAHDRISDLVNEDPTLSGTSTTATVALFDGTQLGMGHVGDSRAYLFRDDELSQLTHDHTFVQSLIDEGRISDEEARVHPHRNLILRALDGIHDADPDLFHVALQPGDRLFLCSDGACGVLDDGRLADILSMGSPDFAAVELVRASLEAGSTDNVTCIVADVVEADPEAAEDLPAPVVVGAAAEEKRRTRTPGGFFRGHRAGDTGELEPVAADIPDDLGYAIPSDPIDPEAARYAPRPPRPHLWLRRSLLALTLLGLLWVAGAAAWSWSQQQYYVGEQDGTVTIFRGIDVEVPLIDVSTAYETSDLHTDQLKPFDVDQVRNGIGADSLADAESKVRDLAKGATPTTTDTTSPSATPSG